MAEEEKKIELPPIEEVACTEAVFREKNMDPAFEAIKEENKLEGDIEAMILPKAAVQKWWETSLQREPFKEEEFTELFNKIPKVEEGKEEVSVLDAAEHLILRAIEIKMVPSRLNRDVDGWREMFQDTEGKINDFLGNDKLSDVTLIHPLTGAAYK